MKIGKRRQSNFTFSNLLRRSKVNFGFQQIFIRNQKSCCKTYNANDDVGGGVVAQEEPVATEGPKEQAGGVALMLFMERYWTITPDEEGGPPGLALHGAEAGLRVDEGLVINHYQGLGAKLVLKDFPPGCRCRRPSSLV